MMESHIERRSPAPLSPWQIVLMLLAIITPVVSTAIGAAYVTGASDQEFKQVRAEIQTLKDWQNGYAATAPDLSTGFTAARWMERHAEEHRAMANAVAEFHAIVEQIQTRQVFMPPRPKPALQQ